MAFEENKNTDLKFSAFIQFMIAKFAYGLLLEVMSTLNFKFRKFNTAYQYRKQKQYRFTKREFSYSQSK